MKNESSLVCTAILCMTMMCGCTKKQDIKFGDPFILAASDGRYYMYGTSLADGLERADRSLLMADSSKASSRCAIGRILS